MFVQVRRKDFWLLSTVNKLLTEFIPRLSHDADGLIFQVVYQKLLTDWELLFIFETILCLVYYVWKFFVCGSFLYELSFASVPYGPVKSFFFFFCYYYEY